MNVAVASADRSLPNRVAEMLPASDTEVAWESTLPHAFDLFESRTFDVFVVAGDVMRDRREENLELLEVVAAQCPATQVVVLVEAHEIEVAARALKAGARHYGRLPMTDEELRILVEAAYATRSELGVNHLRNDPDALAFSEILGDSPPMKEVYRQIRLASTIDVPVLIEGETGTGKDLVAREIHKRSARSGGPYVAVNLGAIPTDLVGSDLFGHVKGAFTGAVESREGKFEQARKGTVFLDEIGTIDERVQVSLLRLLEENRFTRLGGQAPIDNDARVIAATNQPLSRLVEEGIFREDLYYRLDVFRITVPPLRDRTGDIRLLTEEFVQRFSSQFGRDVRSIKEDVWPIIEQQRWNGNIRELKNVLRRSVLACEGRSLGAGHLPSRLSDGTRSIEDTGKVEIRIGTSLKDIERMVIEHTLASVDHNRTEASRILGISRRALYNKMGRHGIG